MPALEQLRFDLVELLVGLLFLVWHCVIFVFLCACGVGQAVLVSPRLLPGPVLAGCLLVLLRGVLAPRRWLSLLLGHLILLGSLWLVPAVGARLRLPGNLLHFDSLGLSLEEWLHWYLALFHH